jgi:putative peptidoglycan lipid II flippase
VIVNIALNLWLVRLLGYRGLALGTSLTALTNAATQLVLLRREIGGIEGRSIAASFGRIAAAAVVMALAAAAADWQMARWLPGETILLQAIRLAWTIGLALVVLVGAAWALRIPELDQARERIVRRLRRNSGQ